MYDNMIMFLYAIEIPITLIVGMFFFISAMANIESIGVDSKTEELRRKISKARLIPGLVLPSSFMTLIICGRESLFNWGKEPGSFIAIIVIAVICILSIVLSPKAPDVQDQYISKASAEVMVKNEIQKILGILGEYQRRMKAADSGSPYRASDALSNLEELLKQRINNGT